MTSPRGRRALLVYLAVEEGVHERDFLAALFWPENERARANLRNTLNYLRQALPQTSAGDTPHLHIDRDTLAFNREAPHHLTLDAQITRAQALLAQGERVEAQALLLAAREKAKAHGMRRGLMAVLAALAQLETGEEAARYRAEGAAVAEAVSASIADEGLWRAFRERPLVAGLLGAAG